MVFRLDLHTWYSHYPNIAHRLTSNPQAQNIPLTTSYKNKPALISSTHLPHRLLTYAALHTPSTQPSLSEDIMLAHHASGTSPSDLSTLCSLAVKHGVFPTEAAAREFLDGDGMDKETEKEYAMARGMGVTGVPFFVFGGKWGVSGAIGEEGFGQVSDLVSVSRPRAGIPMSKLEPRD